MIFTAFPISSTAKLSALFIAAAGGILVFLGLVLEKAAEWLDDRFIPQSYKPHKTLGEIGWIVLMAGIMVEIAVAG